MKPIVVQDTVIDPFCAGAVVIGRFPFRGSPWDWGIKPDVPTGLGVDRPSIRGMGTGAVAGGNPADGKRAAPFDRMFAFVISPADHAVAGAAQRGTVCVDGDGIRYGRRPAPVGIQVDKRSDPPALQEFISGIIVIGGIKTEVPYWNIRGMPPEFMQGNQRIDRVMTPGAGKAEHEGEVDPGVRVIVVKMVKGVAKKIHIEVRIPAMFCIRIRIMAETFVMGAAGIRKRTAPEAFPQRVGMGMDAGAVTGGSKRFRRDKSHFDRRADSGKQEDVLQGSLKVKRNAAILFQA